MVVYTTRDGRPVEPLDPVLVREIIAGLYETPDDDFWIGDTGMEMLGNHQVWDESCHTPCCLGGHAARLLGLTWQGSCHLFQVDRSSGGDSLLQPPGWEYEDCIPARKKYTRHRVIAILEDLVARIEAGSPPVAVWDRIPLSALPPTCEPLPAPTGDCQP